MMPSSTNTNDLRRDEARPPGAHSSDALSPGAPALGAPALGAPDWCPRPAMHERKRQKIAALVPHWYRPSLHVAVPALLGLSVLGFALYHVRALRPAEFIAVPVTLAFTFAFEWCVHRWVLHRRSPGVGILYERHELEHHVAFTHDDMAMRSSRELWLVLMPAYAVVLVALINAPIAYLTATLTSPNAGYLYLATSMVFFLSYEWLHLAYHLPPSSLIGRSTLIARMREHHRRHHDPRRMKRWNFNVTVPLFDAILGTLWSPKRGQEAARRERRRSGSYARPSA
jgi:Fatty acid hydroxylase superfamily